MLETLIWLTAGLCAACALWAWSKYRDVFHPIVLIAPMFGFMYVYMPLRLLEDEQLYSFVTEDQAVFYQTLILVALGVFFAGCFWGSSREPSRSWFEGLHQYDSQAIRKGAYIVGGIGVLAWGYAVLNAGGFTDVFSRPKGYGWSDNAYIREAAYLMIVGLLLLLSPQAVKPSDKKWCVAVALFTLPYLTQGLLGAQRGPTFLAVSSVGLSWYLARRKRPSLPVLLGGGALLGFLMLFLVANRSQIYLGSEFDVKTDVSNIFEATEANEYIFGAGCTVAAEETDRFFWGKRYLAQVLVRPIPSSIWPTKYHDFGVPEILVNAGVAGDGLAGVMGWDSVPGAAAGMVADFWVEFSWLALAALGLIGWSYGYAWKRAAWSGGPWNTIFTVSLLLSVYLVSQSGEAVIFRFIILLLPAYYVWRSSRSSVQEAADSAAPMACRTTG